MLDHVVIYPLRKQWNSWSFPRGLVVLGSIFLMKAIFSKCFKVIYELEYTRHSSFEYFNCFILKFYHTGIDVNIFLIKATIWKKEEWLIRTKTGFLQICNLFTSQITSQSYQWQSSHEINIWKKNVEIFWSKQKKNAFASNHWDVLYLNGLISVWVPELKGSACCCLLACPTKRLMNDWLNVLLKD